MLLAWDGFGYFYEIRRSDWLGCWQAALGWDAQPWSP